MEKGFFLLVNVIHAPKFFGVFRQSGLVHRTQVLMAKSTGCGFESPGMTLVSLSKTLRL